MTNSPNVDTAANRRTCCGTFPPDFLCGSAALSRPVAGVYARIIRENGVGAELLEHYGQ